MNELVYIIFNVLDLWVDGTIQHGNFCLGNRTSDALDALDQNSMLMGYYTYFQHSTFHEDSDKNFLLTTQPFGWI